MRRAVTSCAAACVILTSAGRSAANVSIPFPDWWAELEVVDSQSWVPDTESDGTALASLADVSLDWTDVRLLFSEIAIDETVGGAAITEDALWVPGEPASPAGADKGMVLPDSEGFLWPGISTRPAGYFGTAKALAPSTFADLYTSAITYAHVDLTDPGDLSVLDGLAFEPYLSSGAIVLGGIAVGLIGWLWRRRIFS